MLTLAGVALITQSRNKMPLFKKFTDKIWSSFEDAVDSIGDSFLGYLTSKYPDIDEVFEVLGEMRETYNQSGEEGETDDKWRPMILNLGLLYKLQRIHDSSCGSWYERMMRFN